MIVWRACNRPYAIYRSYAIKNSLNDDWLIDWIVFYAVSAIFQWFNCEIHDERNVQNTNDERNVQNELICKHEGILLSNILNFSYTNTRQASWCSVRFWFCKSLRFSFLIFFLKLNILIGRSAMNMNILWFWVAWKGMRFVKV